MKDLEFVLMEGTPVVTRPDLNPEATTGFFVHPRHLEARRPGIVGNVLCWVPGHGGDVYAVDHPDGTCGVYGYWEIEYNEGWEDALRQRHPEGFGTPGDMHHMPIEEYILRQGGRPRLETTP